MSVEDNRTSHLRRIIDAEAARAGGKLRAGYRAVASAAGLGEEYIYQLYTGKKKVIGSDAARAIARAFGEGKPQGWFDYPPQEKDGLPKTTEDAMRAMPTLGATIKHLGALVATMDRLGRESLAPLIARVIENPEMAEQAAAMADALAAAQAAPVMSAPLGAAYGRARNRPVESEHAPLETPKSR